MPEVSVIVPNYNHAPYLKQRIDSILAQTFLDYELILLDDCSTDNSSDILNSYSHHAQISHIIFNQHNSGSPFSQWEKGLSVAKGKWVWIAESDDFAEPLFLEKLLATARQNPDAGIVYCGSHWVDAQGECGEDLSSYTESFCRNGHEEITEKLWYVCTIQNVSSCIMRRDIATICIRGLGKYRACGDWMFYVKMLHDTDLAFTAEKLNYFRYYHNNTSHWAEKAGLWTTEGVNTLQYLNHRKLRLSKQQLRYMTAHWYYRVKNVDGIKKYRAYYTIARSAGRYLLANFFDRP